MTNIIPGIYRKHDGMCFEVLGLCTNPDSTAEFVFYKQCADIQAKCINGVPFYHCVETELKSSCIWLRTTDSFSDSKMFEESMTVEPRFKFVTCNFRTGLLYDPNIVCVLSQHGFPINLGFYRHYKGSIYKVIGLCMCIDINQELILYLDPNGKCFVTKLGLFFRKIELMGNKVSRFEFVL